MLSGLRIEHLCDIIVCLHSFNVSPTKITDLVRNVSDEKIH